MNEACIVGGGSIGGIIAYYLYRGGASEIVTYYGSEESVEEVERSGGLVVAYGGEEHLVPIVPRHFSEPASTCKYVVNAVKAYSVEQTIELMNKITNDSSLILMVQNGFGSLELAEERLSNRLVSCGVVFIGAERVSRSKVVHNGGNTIFSGCRKRKCTEELEGLGELLRRGGCDFRVVEDIDFYRWIKLGLNAVVNPLTAITLSKNKIVLTEPGLKLAEAIIGEVVEAARRRGYELEAEKLMKLVIRSVESVAENYSSMVQDILRSGVTEVDYINGYVARILGENSINGVLTSLVHLIELSKRERASSKETR